jgi:phosphate uptake regulator
MIDVKEFVQRAERRDEAEIKPYFQASTAIIELFKNAPVSSIKSLSHYCQC